MLTETQIKERIETMEKLIKEMRNTKLERDFTDYAKTIIMELERVLQK